MFRRFLDYKQNKTLYTFIVLIGFWFGFSDSVNAQLVSSDEINEAKAVTSYLESATSVSVVFASQYVGNPASIMGHTFLKFNDEKISDNLRPSVNYGASVADDVGPIEYVLKGLFGGFIGQYGLESYFQKKKEYRDIENRNLWEYELNLTPHELALLKANLANDFSASHRPYFFLDQNCSYEILRQIEKTRGSNQFSEATHFYVLPHETIRWLDEHGYIKARKFLPALRNQLLAKYDKLNKSQKMNVLNSWSQVMLTDLTTANEFDVILLKLQMDEYRNHGMLPSDRKVFEVEALKKRSLLGKSEPDNDFKLTDPSDGHRPHLVRFDLSEKIFGVLLSPGIHHLYQDSFGFSPQTEMSFLEFQFAYYKIFEKWHLDQFNFVTMSSWSEYSEIDPKYSWRIKLFDQREPKAFSEFSRSQRLELASGYGLRISELEFSFLAGALLVNGNTRGALDGSRFQLRFLGTYQFERKWRTYLEAFNSSEQLQDKFVDVKHIIWNLTRLNIVKNFDFGLQADLTLSEKHADNTKLSLVTQYSF